MPKHLTSKTVALPVKNGEREPLTAAGSSAWARARGRRGRGGPLAACPRWRRTGCGRWRARGGWRRRRGRGCRRPRAAWLMVEPALKQWMCARPGRRAWRALDELEAGAQIGEARGLGMARGLLRRDAIGPQRDLVVEACELGPLRPGRRRSRSRGSRRRSGSAPWRVTTVTPSARGDHVEPGLGEMDGEAGDGGRSAAPTRAAAARPRRRCRCRSASAGRSSRSA